MNCYIEEKQAGNAYIGSFVKALFNHKNIEIFITVSGKKYILFSENGYYKRKDTNNNVEILTEENMYNICMAVCSCLVSYKVL